jgi:hypothetical protein
MPEIKRRRPQSRCKCGHARSQHFKDTKSGLLSCWFCWEECKEFTQDNLATLERLYQYNEEKKKETSKLSV